MTHTSTNLHRASRRSVSDYRHGDVRQEWIMMSERAGMMFSALEIELPESVQADVAAWVRACECFDRLVDDAETRSDRLQLGNQIIDAIRTPGYDFSELPRELADHIKRVTTIFSDYNDRVRIARSLKRLQRISEDLRLCRRRGDYIRLSANEGVFFGRLFKPLLMPFASRRAWKRFMIISQAGNLVDQLFDLPADARRGELELKPGLLLRGRIALAILPRFLILFFIIRRKARFMRWVFPFFRPGLHTSAVVADPQSDDEDLDHLAGSRARGDQRDHRTLEELV